MRVILSIVALLLLIGLSGCGYKEGVATGDQKSYLYFNGNVSDVKVSVDGGAQFDVKSGRDNQYEVKPGKHVVTVYRNNEIIVNREIFLGDGIAKEMEVK